MHTLMLIWAEDDKSVHAHIVKHLKPLNLIIRWEIKHTMKALDNSMQRFAHHGLLQAYKIENKMEGDNIPTSTVSNDSSVLV